MFFVAQQDDWSVWTWTCFHFFLFTLFHSDEFTIHCLTLIWQTMISALFWKIHIFLLTLILFVLNKSCESLNVCVKQNWQVFGWETQGKTKKTCLTENCHDRRYNIDWKCDYRPLIKSVTYVSIKWIKKKYTERKKLINFFLMKRRTNKYYQKIVTRYCLIIIIIHIVHQQTVMLWIVNKKSESLYVMSLSNNVQLTKIKVRFKINWTKWKFN